jgi:hypothetical protein
MFLNVLQPQLLIKMKKATALAFASLTLCLTFFALFTVTAHTDQSVGVKEWDWIEYDITTTGTGNVPPSHDVRWARMEVLSVDRAAFSINVSVIYTNETRGSAVWKFNFTEGNTGGWTVIPANLSPGDTFFDYSQPQNVTIQQEEQKSVLGAIRTITCGNDSIRQIKEWDKATGFFIGSVEVAQNYTNPDGWYFDNLTTTIKATATNLWNRQIFGLEQTVFALVISGLVFVVISSVSALIMWQSKKITNLSLRYPLLSKKIISAIIIVGIVVFSAIVIPSIWMNMGLSTTETNMIMQTVWLSLLLVSLGFRKIGKHFIYGFLMAAVIIATLISFSSVIAMWSPSDSSSMSTYVSSPLKIAEFIAHGVLSLPALALGVWFIALWRPNATTDSTKINKIVKLMMILWILSYIAGIVGYVLDYTTLLGVYY